MISTNKPLIGIVAKTSIEDEMWHYLEIVEDIRLRLIEQNAQVIGILPPNKVLDFNKRKNVLTEEEKKELEETILLCDGIVLEGGLASHLYEEEAARICIKHDIPVLGICACFNNLVRALGGVVHKDESKFHKKFAVSYAHEVSIEEDSKLFSILKRNQIMVNSIHENVCLEEEIKEYDVAARCDGDHTVEAIELKNKRFVLGIKWHPELMEEMTPIFEAFVTSCTKREEL